MTDNMTISEEEFKEIEKKLQRVNDMAVVLRHESPALSNIAIQLATTVANLLAAFGARSVSYAIVSAERDALKAWVEDAEECMRAIVAASDRDVAAET